MAATTVMPVQILAVGDLRKFTGEGGRVSRQYPLQCFTGDVVGQLPHYLRDDEPEVPPQAGHYMATIAWSNYQGRLTPRVIALEPRKNLGAGEGSK